MNHNIRKFLAVASCALAVSLVLCFVILAWSDPGATPPNGNVVAPLNTGAILQNKIGDLLIGAGLKISSLGTAFVLKTNDSSQTARVVVGQDGNVGIGTAVPSKKLEVAGDTKSSKFCLGDQCCSSWGECAALGGCAKTDCTRNKIWVQQTVPVSFYQPSPHSPGIAGSSDGTKLIAVGYTGSNLGIYISLDSGLTWTKSYDYSGSVVASSADGKKLFVAGSQSIVISMDAGKTWTAQMYNNPGDIFSGKDINSIAASADGTKLAVAAYDDSRLYTSTDSGATWTARYVLMAWPGCSPTSLVSSADGTKLAVLCVGHGAFARGIYTSADSGATWVYGGIRPFDSFGDVGGYYQSLAMSADGAKLAVADTYDEDSSRDRGYIFVSSDFGKTWTKVLGTDARNWKSIAISADGAKLVAFAAGDTKNNVYSGDYLFTSDDFGSTWCNKLLNGFKSSDGVYYGAKRSLLFSANGAKLIALDENGRVWTNY